MSGAGDTLRLAAGVTLDHLALAHSHDGQYLLIYCGEELLAIYGAMGGNVATIEFADGGCYSVEEVLGLVAAV
ncbi:MAG: hypothetical protein A3H93_15970 [Rhodocyclales bacterium RIFCSPLOWO2_02_FULL_63_24]|nr:MAG: hypothetical protein A2040_19225 [Rhodocyclales bacterium GWA2_65_19]OHC72353.1 MAG: hypothetical protein A3H93_15970 [Rhodocyclales bacterium RIFCSPLOWO2_02_FULL_63_24]